MNNFWKHIEWLSDKLKATGSVCLAGMVLLTCLDVIGRALGHPIPGAIEIVGFFATLTAATALPYTHKMKAHIGVEVFMQMLSRRTQIITEIFTEILGFAFFGLATWRMAVYAHTIQKSGEVSMDLKFPEYIIIYMISFCFFVFFLLLLQSIVQNIMKLRGRK